MNKGVNSACDLTLSFVVPYGFMCVGLSFRVTLRMGSCFIKKSVSSWDRHTWQGPGQDFGRSRSFRLSVPTGQSGLPS